MGCQWVFTRSNGVQSPSLFKNHAGSRCLFPVQIIYLRSDISVCTSHYYHHHRVRTYIFFTNCSYTLSKFATPPPSLSQMTLKILLQKDLPQYRMFERLSRASIYARTVLPQPRRPISSVSFLKMISQEGGGTNLGLGA